MKARYLTAFLAMVALIGCTLTKSDLRQGADAILPKVGGQGRLMMPKQCALKMVLIARPPTDEALHRTLWEVADAQAAEPEVREALESNGLRVGLITGNLPATVRALLDAPPPNKVEPSTILLPDGESTLVELGATSAELNLLLNRQGSVNGKRYQDANGHIRLTPTRQGDSGVALKIVPELHHGPVRKGWGAASGGGSGVPGPQQLVTRNGQQEETFRDLAATLTLHPGQIAVIGALPERKGSLGPFLFAPTEANSDRPLQGVLLVWASRSEDAPIDLKPPVLEPIDPPDLPESSRRVSARNRTAAPESLVAESAGPDANRKP